MALTKINNNTLSAITGLPAGVGGKVLQVVSTSAQGSTQSTSTSYTDASAGLTLNITPSATSSKILVTFTGSIYNNGTHNVYTTIFRDSTNIGSTAGDLGMAYRFDRDDSTGGMAMSILDSPSSSSQIAYTIKIKMDGGLTYLKGGDTKSTITAFEIAG